MHGDADAAKFYEQYEEPEAQVLCAVCHSGDDTESSNDILLCDAPGCEAACHMKCLQPALDQVPVGDWWCSACMCARRCLHTLVT